MQNQSMAPLKNSRRLTLLDLMIAVAGLAIGLWIMPNGLIDVGGRHSQSSPDHTPSQ